MTIKHETITVSGTVMYCDGRGARGHEEAYDNASLVIDEAQQLGWHTGDECDLCPDCVRAEKTKKRKGVRRG